MAHDTPTPEDLRGSVTDRFSRIATAPKQEESIRFGAESTIRLEENAEAIGSCPPT